MVSYRLFFNYPESSTFPWDTLYRNLILKFVNSSYCAIHTHLFCKKTIFSQSFVCFFDIVEVWHV
jgi:hypothetical protein